MPENLTSSRLQAADPAARTLALAELELAEAARRASDFARGMVPNGHPVDLEPGMLVQDALSLADHARQVLVAAIRHERARGTGDTVITGIVDAAGGGLARDAMTAAEAWFPNVRSEATAERLFELDTWVRRHTDHDDPLLCTQPVTAAVAGQLAGPGRVSPAD